MRGKKKTLLDHYLVKQLAKLIPITLLSSQMEYFFGSESEKRGN